jgi:hypothetical protein
MAFAITDFCGFETGGLDEVSASAGTPDATEATVVANGVRSVLLNSTADEFEFVFSGGVQNDYIIGFRCQFSNLAPGTEYRFWGIRDAGTSWLVEFFLETDGDLRIDYTQDATSTTVATPFTVDEWHYFEIKLTYHATAGVVVTYLDDGEIANDTGLDTIGDGSEPNVTRWWGPSAGNLYVDDIYRGVGATGVSDFLGSGVNIPRCYQNTVEDATDQGTTLDEGSWAVAGEFPVTDQTVGTDAAAYTAAGIETGYTICDEGARSGPSGGPAIGTIKAGKWFIRAERGNGSATTHTHRYGNNNTDSGYSISLGAAPSNHFVTFSASNAVVPESTEYAVGGFSKSSGGREIYCHELMAFLLTVDAGGPADLTVSEADSAAPGESVTVDPLLLAGVVEADSATPSEVVTVQLQLDITESDAATPGEAVTVDPLLLEGVVEADSATPSDSIKLQQESYISETDAVTLGDSASISVEVGVLEISESDSAAPAEAVTVDMVRLLSVSDAVSLGEATTVTVSDPQVSASDAVSLA